MDENKEAMDEECSICFDEFKYPVAVPEGCKHRFCWPCLSDWLSRDHDTCPIDRHCLKKYKLQDGNGNVVKQFSAKSSSQLNILKKNNQPLPATPRRQEARVRAANRQPVAAGQIVARPRAQQAQNRVQPAVVNRQHPVAVNQGGNVARVQPMNNVAFAAVNQQRLPVITAGAQPNNAARFVAVNQGGNATSAFTGNGQQPAVNMTRAQPNNAAAGVAVNQRPTAVNQGATIARVQPINNVAPAAAVNQQQAAVPRAPQLNNTITVRVNGINIQAPRGSNVSVINNRIYINGQLVNIQGAAGTQQQVFTNQPTAQANNVVQVTGNRGVFINGYQVNNTQRAAGVQQQVYTNQAAVNPAQQQNNFVQRTAGTPQTPRVQIANNTAQGVFVNQGPYAAGNNMAQGAAAAGIQQAAMNRVAQAQAQAQAAIQQAMQPLNNLAHMMAGNQQFVVYQGNNQQAGVNQGQPQNQRYQ